VDAGVDEEDALNGGVGEGGREAGGGVDGVHGGVWFGEQLNWGGGCPEVHDEGTWVSVDL